MRYSGNFSEVLWFWNDNYSAIEQLLFQNGSAVKSNQDIVRDVIVGIVLSTLALAACLGNILVVLSVFTNRRLRTVTNFFVVSLAISDLCVSILVMPLGIIVELTGKWLFGSILCEIWVSCDVMLCTASILNLCCISLDRYFAITKPLVYSTKRSKRLAMSMIAVVWVAAVIITCPPIFGWQEEGRLDDTSFCTLTKDPGYIVYSSLGSFYVPLTVMVFVYIRIFIVAIKREKRLRPYKKNFISGSLHKRKGRRKSSTKSLSSSGPSLAESLTLNTCATREENRGEESRESDDTDEKTIETRLLKENGNDLIRRGKCVSVKRLHDGLVINSAMAMQDIARAHRNSLRNSHRKATLAHNTSANTYLLQNHHSTTHHHHHTHHHLTHHHRHASLPNSCQTTPVPIKKKLYKNASQGGIGANVSATNSNGSNNVAAAMTSSSSQQNNARRPLDYFAKRDERRKERAALLKEHKAAKTLAIVVGGFVVCWLPFFLMYIIAPFCNCYIDPHMESFFTWLGYFNSVLNPGIYALYNRDFRYSFWKLTFGRCRQRRNPDQFA